MTATRLARYILEHATCGRRYAGGSMSVTVAHHGTAWFAHIICSMPH